MGQGVTNVAGIEIPSTDPLFLSIVGAHILVGIAAVGFGAAAIFSKKRRGRHSSFGTYYYWSVLAVVATAATATVMRVQENLDVMALGLLCLAAVTIGWTALRRRWPVWVPVHITGMGLSYIILLTAFYVENGADLPLWNLLPPITYWLGPAAVGIPIVVMALWLHHVARRARAKPRAAER